MIVRATAPLRLDFAGGGSDCPPYSAEHGGATLNAAIDLRATVTIDLFGRYDPITLHAGNASCVLPRSRDDGIISKGALRLLEAAVKRFDLDVGCKITVEVGAPPGSGLGASSATMVAAVAGLMCARGQPFVAADVAYAAHELERNVLGDEGGWQDEFAAALGGANFLRIRDPKVTAEALPADSRILRDAEGSLLLVYTGTSRVSSQVIAEIQRRYIQDPAAVLPLFDGLKLAAERQRQAYIAGDIEAFYGFMAHTWQCFRQLHPAVADPAYDAFFLEASLAGATSAKCCGAGGGGCMMCCCPGGTFSNVRSRLSGMGGTTIPFHFTEEGVRAVRVQCPMRG